MSSEAEVVVGRESELDALATFLDAVAEHPVALRIEGEVGIGKTTLWKPVVAGAHERSYHVLVSRPVESETQLAFAALGDLLENVPTDAMSALPEPQLLAIEVALLRREAEGPAPQPRAVALGLLGVLRSLAETRPVLLAVDDVQWLDRPSASALEFVARRLGGGPIGLLVARRLEAGGVGAPDFELALPDGRFERLSVGPLDLDTLDRLLRARADVQLNRATLVQLHAASGGNPFFALEIARNVIQRELRPTPGEPLPVPDNLRALVAERLASLSPPARDVALVVAVLPRATIELVRAGAGASGTDAALAEAVDAGVLEADGERVRFSHPLLASVLYAGATGAERRTLHARLATVLDDPEERAGHRALAAAGPDAAVAAELDEAAERARARGAPDAAATLWEQARRFTPDDFAAEACSRGIEAAECHFEAGETERARTLLEEIVAASPPGSDRARALNRLAWVRAFTEGFHMGAELFEAALAEVGDDLRLQVETERGLAWSIHETGDVAAAEARAHHALELAEQLGEKGVLASALADVAVHESLRGNGLAFTTIERALALESDVGWHPILSRPRWIHGMLLQWAGNLDGSRAALETLRRDVIAQGDEHSLSHVLVQLARTECLAGNWERAARYAEESYEAVAQVGESERPYALTIKAFVDAHLGRAEGARAETDEGLPLALRLGVLPAYFDLLAIRGFLELSLGSAAEAHRFLGPLPQAVREAGFGEPALFRFHGDAIETLLALGQTEEATALLAELEEQGRALQRVWALAIASRCRALLSAAGGEIERAYDQLDRALRLHDQLGEPFERARTLLVLGTIQRRGRKKRPARESLEQALAVFDELGAVLWSEKARAELARIGGRAPASGALTPTEERVAALVAAGGTYREVADALFISPKTVQWNLSKIYRKLGVRSRGELAAKLAAEGGSPGDAPLPAGGQSPAVPPVPE
jgi:DNA-binding CsgD family transcriptional regulator